LIGRDFIGAFRCTLIEYIEDIGLFLLRREIFFGCIDSQNLRDVAFVVESFLEGFAFS
jgi:hypothetical protein